MVSTLALPTLERRAVRLAWATIAWNVVEAVVAIAAGTAASSIALVGFGLDSTVEVMSALVIVWQLRGLSHARERRALRLIAVSFYVLALYVSVQAIIDLLRNLSGQWFASGHRPCGCVARRHARSRPRQAA